MNIPSHFIWIKISARSDWIGVLSLCLQRRIHVLRSGKLQKCIYLSTVVNHYEQILSMWWTNLWMISVCDYSIFNIVFVLAIHVRAWDGIEKYKYAEHVVKIKLLQMKNNYIFQCFIPCNTYKHCYNYNLSVAMRYIGQLVMGIINTCKCCCRLSISVAT